MGCAVLPHLKGLVDCIGPNLNDDQTKVRTVTSLAIAALAEAANPYGIESFDDILNPLWTGARQVPLFSCNCLNNESPSPKTNVQNKEPFFGTFTQTNVQNGIAFLGEFLQINLPTLALLFGSVCNYAPSFAFNNIIILLTHVLGSNVGKA